MFGMGFYEWMAFIGGYPTIFTTIGTILLIVFAGTRAIYRHKDFKNVKYHIKETLLYEEQIKYLLKDAKPLTKLRFKRLIGEEAYVELTYVEVAPVNLTLKQRYIKYRLSKALDNLVKKGAINEKNRKPVHKNRRISRP